MHSTAYCTSFDIKLAAELAAGTALVPVNIHDLSSTGCGVEILTQDPDLVEKIGVSGLLQLQATDQGVTGAVRRLYCGTCDLKATYFGMDLSFDV